MRGFPNNGLELNLVVAVASVSGLVVIASVGSSGGEKVGSRLVKGSKDGCIMTKVFRDWLTYLIRPVEMWLQ